MPGRDTRTRWQGIYARHKQGCAVEALPGRQKLAEIADACDCDPTYYGKAYDRRARRHAVTKRHATPAAARGARKGLVDLIDKGESRRPLRLRLREAYRQFVRDAEEGRALNKHGREYKPSAIKDIDECLRVHVVPTLGPMPMDEVRRGDVQKLIDGLTSKMSGSRLRSVVSAIRSLYRWAEERELVGDSPAARVRLPAQGENPRERIASPAEFVALLAALPIEDALPYALAGYAMGRRAQIQCLRWDDVELDLGLVDWGVERAARKSRAARRVVPTVKPLLILIRRAYEAQGCPAGDRRVCPPRQNSKSGLLHTNGLAERAETKWDAKKLQPIGLQECRHTAATWLDAAGVSPKVASELMGHSTPALQAGAAPITLARYTHLMPDAIEKARRQLDAWLEVETAKGFMPGGAVTPEASGRRGS